LTAGRKSNAHRDLFIGIVLAVVFAAVLETGQNFVPSRHGEMHDFIIKALAVILGAVAVRISRGIKRRSSY